MRSGRSRRRAPVSIRLYLPAAMGSGKGAGAPEPAVAAQTSSRAAIPICRATRAKRELKQDAEHVERALGEAVLELIEDHGAGRVSAQAQDEVWRCR
jgi:hypothetical protein